ncbi:MAG TPA: ABC transporter permease subunit [Polyangiaceae bacterium]|nr:ABC transporter permease subunit [Polyangiaceae bacterium]
MSDKAKKEEDEKKKKLAEEGDDEDEDTTSEGDDDGDEGDEEESDDSADADEKPAKAPPMAAREAPKVSASFARNLWTITKREFAGYFNSALAYIVISASMVLFGLYFFFYQGGIWQVDRASMSRMFDFVPAWICFLTIPLFTMRAMSEEKRLGTIELLITLPVRDSEVVLGKYLGALGVLVVQIALLAIYPIAMFKFPWNMGAFDWGPFWSSMFGLFLMGAAGIAIGMLYSGMTESQIVSYFATASTLLILFFVGSLVQFVKGWPGEVISFFSFQTRYEPFSRGLIDTRAVVYFVSVTVLCLLESFRQLEGRRWR